MTDFSSLLQALVNGRVEFILVGGVAAVIHGSARLTVDVDIVYRRTTGNVERLISSLAPYYRISVGRRQGYPFAGNRKRCNAA